MLHMNLDEFNAVCGSAFTESERSALLGGLQLGCNGGCLPEGASNSLRSGFEVASGWRANADGFKAKSSEGGKKSAENRKLKYGTSNPKGVRRDFEVGSEVGFVDTTKQSLIPNPLSLNPTSPPQPPKRRVKKDTSQIPTDLLQGLGVLCSDWPRFSQKPDGPRQDLRLWSDPVDLWEAMCKYFPLDDKALMVKCGLVYLDKIIPITDGPDPRPQTPPAFAYAMANFYGPKLAYWKNFKEDAQKTMESK